MAADEHWVSWAPTSPENIARLGQGYRTFAVHAQPARTQHFMLHVLALFEPVVGVDEAALLLNLWRHPLFDPKYKDVLQSACVTRQPVDTGTIGSTGPTPA